MEENKIDITTYDFLLRAWENSMELVRDFEMYSKRIENNKEISELFKKFAEDEGYHASALREKLMEMKDQRYH